MEMNTNVIKLVNSLKAMFVLVVAM